MPNTMKLSKLANMPHAERESVLNALVYAALHGSNGGKAELKTQIKNFEIRYEMDSVDMRRRFAKGEIRETAEIAEWLFLLETCDTCD